MASIPARTFKNGNSTALRLPASLGIKPGEEWVLIQSKNNSLTLQPKRIGLGDLISTMPESPADFFPNGRQKDLPVQERSQQRLAQRSLKPKRSVKHA